jgi:hypothetical protein
VLNILASTEEAFAREGGAVMAPEELLARGDAEA